MIIRSNQMLKWAGLLIIGAVCTSCSTLKSPHLVGEQEPLSDKDLASETIWMQGDDVYFVKRVDSNTLVAATLEWDANSSDFAVRSFPVVLSKLGDHVFLNVGEGGLYSIFRVAVACDDETLLIFTIDPDKLKEDMAAGTIQARKEGDDIIMECTKEEQDAYILKNINTMFHMGNASIVRPISGQKE